MNYKEIL